MTDTITSFAAGLVLGLVFHAVYDVVKEARRLDRMDASYMEQLRMQERDDRGQSWRG